MSRMLYKTFVYYIVETKDDFIKEKTHEIFINPNHRILRVLPTTESIIFKSSVDKKSYKVTLSDFIDNNKIIESFNIILN